MNRGKAQKFISELLKYDLKQGRKKGTWYKFHNHVYGVALMAEKIAEKLGLDSEKAYILGLMHDCGKIYEMYEKRFHGVIGYEMFKDKDSDIAKVSMTHSFYYNMLPRGKDFDRYFYGNVTDKEFVKKYVKNNKLDEYDKIIQLSDSLANCNGLVTIDEREKEFSERYNFKMPSYIVKNSYKMKEEFDERLGCDLYCLFDEIDKSFMLKPGQDVK